MNTTNVSGTLQITTPSDREIAMTRVFDVPRKLVWDAHTKPELVKQWLGVFGGWTLAVCEIDLRVGGRYRYVWRGPGKEMGMGGEFREIVTHERLVTTEKFDEPWYEGDAIDTMEFLDSGGKTTLRMTVLYDSKAIRDAVLASGMKDGMTASYDGLATLLGSLKA